MPPSEGGADGRLAENGRPLPIFSKSFPFGLGTPAAEPLCMTTQRFAKVTDGSDDTIFALRQLAARRLATDCLETAQAFMDESHSWGKQQLAMWLLGAYTAVAQNVEALPPSTRPEPRHVAPETIANLIDNARAEVQFKLDRLNDPWTSADVALEMIEAGFVAPIIDANGASGWAPTTSARRLADRVLSLFVAAFMQRPERASIHRMPLAA